MRCMPGEVVVFNMLVRSLVAANGTGMGESLIIVSSTRRVTDWAKIPHTTRATA